MPLEREVGLSPSDIVLDADTVLLPRKAGRAPRPPPKKKRISAHVYRDQTAGWIKMTLGMEAGLDRGHILLDGDPTPTAKKWTQPPIFGPCLL